eukprot:GFKZ01004806.1.p1 GENE.GFKZ01004806.1~~GFKZ01004806.1.p1  ORF type:complete len:158 (-),score=18.05 GFKZ01004806.1:67-540(-)
MIRSGNYRDIICFNCNRRGHKAFACPSRGFSTRCAFANKIKYIQENEKVPLPEAYRRVLVEFAEDMENAVHLLSLDHASDEEIEAHLFSVQNESVLHFSNTTAAHITESDGLSPSLPVQPGTFFTTPINGTPSAESTLSSDAYEFRITQSEKHGAKE